MKFLKTIQNDKFGIFLLVGNLFCIKYNIAKHYNGLLLINILGAIFCIMGLINQYKIEIWKEKLEQFEKQQQLNKK